MIFEKLLRKGLFLYNGRKVEINGEQYQIPIALSGYFSLLSNNIIEQELINYIDNAVIEGDSLIDIGANIGIISSHVANRVGPNGFVYAFEPNPRVYKYLNEIMKKNTLFRNWLINQSAISNSNGLACFSISMEDSVLMERSGLLQVDANSGQQKVCTVTLDSIFSEVEVNWLKIDVEGAEMQVLEGGKSLFEKQKPNCIIEIHGLYFDEPKEHAKKIFDFFTEKGYRAFNIMKNDWETLTGFIEDTGVEIMDRINNVDLSKSCYGNIVFLS